MNRRKMMYNRYYNRKRTNRRKVIVTFCCLALICFYSYTKFRETSVVDYIADKVEFWNKSIDTLSNNDITSKDISKELDELNKKKNPTEKESSNKNENSSEVENKEKEVSKIATIDSWNVYTVQIASVDNDEKLKKIQNTLISSKIPFSVMEKDGVKKVQTFCSFDKDVTRASVDEVKDKFPDAFVSTLEAPVVSLKYTNKFSAAEEVSKDINTLAKNFEEESKFWNENKNTENLNKETYKNIMSNRKTIIESIETSAKQLDYNEMKEFKEGLLRFTQSVGDKLEISIKGVEESKYDISTGLMLSSIQEYCQFIISIE
ncbi:hypothetical protein [Metaclostridioides mangenotii]|uniref:hypothetical protein n=1 Tax=Metaclostridioides mangenotii TaxID=1540 RepID=UPI0004653EEA|nr:hypothetical protein [Clostridioides mangenotii]